MHFHAPFSYKTSPLVVLVLTVIALGVVALAEAAAA
jgi:hypothetical protein